MQVNIDWDDLRYFLAVARHGSLARAGSAQRTDPTTVGRRIAALEERLGARVFDRTPSGWVVTPVGRDLLPHAERMEAEALAAERELAGADKRIAGVVRVTATEMIATRFIAPHLARLRDRHPDLTLDLVCSNQTLDLARREADVALRLARPKQEGIVTKRLAHIDLALYASDGYAAARGMPDDAEASLAGHSVVMFASSRAFAIENEWIEQRRDGAHVALRSDSVSSIFSAVLGGAGIGLLPRLVAEAEPSLRRVETRTTPEPRVIWQMVHRDLKDSAKIRAVLEFLGELLTEAPPGAVATPTRARSPRK